MGSDRMATKARVAVALRPVLLPAWWSHEHCARTILALRCSRPAFGIGSAYGAKEVYRQCEDGSLPAGCFWH